MSQRFIEVELNYGTYVELRTKMGDRKHHAADEKEHGPSVTKFQTNSGESNYRRRACTLASIAIEPHHKDYSRDHVSSLGNNTSFESRQPRCLADNARHVRA